MTQILERFALEPKYVPHQRWQNPGSSAWAVFEAPLWSESFYRDTSAPLRHGHDIPEGHPRIDDSFNSFKDWAAAFMSNHTGRVWPLVFCFLNYYCQRVLVLRKLWNKYVFWFCEAEQLTNTYAPPCRHHPVFHQDQDWGGGCFVHAPIFHA